MTKNNRQYCQSMSRIFVRIRKDEEKNKIKLEHKLEVSPLEVVCALSLLRFNTTISVTMFANMICRYCFIKHVVTHSFYNRDTEKIRYNDWIIYKHEILLKISFVKRER